MLRDLRFLLSTFSRRERALLVVYVIAQLSLALMDLVGIAIVLPILQIVSDTPLDQGYIGTIHRALGEPSREALVVVLAGAMVLAFTLKSVFGLVAHWWASGFVGRLQARTARRLLTAHLRGPFLERRGETPADLIRVIATGVADAHGKVLASILALAASIMSILVVIVFLFAVQPIPTLFALVYFGATVFTMQRILGKRNRAAGEAAVMASWASSHAIVDVVDGFREVRMHNAEPEFAERYDQANTKTIHAARKAGLYATIPKYALELITISGIALLLGVSVFTMDSQQLMTVMGLFVAVAIRMLPTLAGLTAQLGMVRNGQHGLGIVAERLRQLDLEDLDRGLTSRTHDAPEAPLPLAIEDVHFRYPGMPEDVLRGISFTVPPGSSIALLGLSGSGKTTLVDLILGLHEPRLGQIRYGDDRVHELGASWRDSVSYVPQDVYIVDDSVLVNVAFGERPAEIDTDRAKAALQEARLLDVVEQLPEGIHTRVGGRGTRLSGGQRQRLGIARALYRRPAVIVFDEATSALDNRTEHEIAAAIAGLHGHVTTIQIAHRLSTVKNVDRIVYLSQGEIAATGSFDEVMAKSDEFAHLVALGQLDTDSSIRDPEIHSN